MNRRALAAFLCVLTSFAQDGARGMALFGLASRPELRWRLYTLAPTPGVVQPQTLDGRLRPLLASGLSWARLTQARLQVLAEQAGVAGSDLNWLLLDPGGKARGHGVAPCDPERVEEAIRSVLGTLPWDHFDAVLRGNKLHGEARLARLEWTLALIYPFPGPGAPDFPLVFRPAGDFLAARNLAGAALADLRKVPGWAGQVPLSAPGLGPRLRVLLDANTFDVMAKELVVALAAEPAHPLLQENLAFLHRLGRGDALSDLAESWGSIEPLPGQPWPPLPLLRAHLDRLLAMNRAPDARFMARSWSRSADRLFVDPPSWKLHVLREATLEAYACIAETRMEETQAIVVDSLDRIREKAGAGYVELARFYLSWVKFPDDPEFRKTVVKLAARPGLPAPPMPEPFPPWRITLAERQDLAPLKDAFDEDRDLLLWLPSECGLGLQQAQPAPLEAWLGPERRFAPEAAPGHAQLADVLVQGRPGRLRTAEDHVDRAPDRPGRRRFRIPLLLERMPAKFLEHLLAEDLRSAGTFALLRFPTDANLWWVEAQRAVPELEEHLHHWPLDGERWAALAFWSGFLPSHPGPAALANSQPSWQPQLPFCLALPPSAHDAIGEQLVHRRAWIQLQAWFEPAWHGLLRLRAEDLQRWPWLTGTASASFRYLDKAYAGLGQEGRRRALRESWAVLPGAGLTAP